MHRYVSHAHTKTSSPYHSDRLAAMANQNLEISTLELTVSQELVGLPRTQRLNNATMAVMALQREKQVAEDG